MRDKSGETGKPYDEYAAQHSTYPLLIGTNTVGTFLVTFILYLLFCQVAVILVIQNISDSSPHGSSSIRKEVNVTLACKKINYSAPFEVLHGCTVRL